MTPEERKKLRELANKQFMEGLSDEEQDELERLRETAEDDLDNLMNDAIESTQMQFNSADNPFAEFRQRRSDMNPPEDAEQDEDLEEDDLHQIQVLNADMNAEGIAPGQIQVPDGAVNFMASGSQNNGGQTTEEMGVLEELADMKLQDPEDPEEEKQKAVEAIRRRRMAKLREFDAAEEEIHEEFVDYIVNSQPVAGLEREKDYRYIARGTGTSGVDIQRTGSSRLLEHELAPAYDRLRSDLADIEKNYFPMGDTHNQFRKLQFKFEEAYIPEEDSEARDKLVNDYVNGKAPEFNKPETQNLAEEEEPDAPYVKTMEELAQEQERIHLGLRLLQNEKITDPGQRQRIWTALRKITAEGMEYFEALRDRDLGTNSEYYGKLAEQANGKETISYIRWLRGINTSLENLTVHTEINNAHKMISDTAEKRADLDKYIDSKVDGFYLNKTKYSEYKKSYDEAVAKEQALDAYYREDEKGNSQYKQVVKTVKESITAEIKNLDEEYEIYKANEEPLRLKEEELTAQDHQLKEQIAANGQQLAEATASHQMRLDEQKRANQEQLAAQKQANVQKMDAQKQANQEMLNAQKANNTAKLAEIEQQISEKTVELETYRQKLGENRNEARETYRAHALKQEEERYQADKVRAESWTLEEDLPDATDEFFASVGKEREELLQQRTFILQSEGEQVSYVKSRNDNKVQLEKLRQDNFTRNETWRQKYDSGKHTFGFMASSEEKSFKADMDAANQMEKLCSLTDLWCSVNELTADMTMNLNPEDRKLTPVEYGTLLAQYRNRLIDMVNAQADSMPSEQADEYMQKLRNAVKEEDLGDVAMNLSEWAQDQWDDVDRVIQTPNSKELQNDLDTVRKNHADAKATFPTFTSYRHNLDRLEREKKQKETKYKEHLLENVEKRHTENVAAIEAEAVRSTENIGQDNLNRLQGELNELNAQKEKQEKTGTELLQAMEKESGEKLEKLEKESTVRMQKMEQNGLDAIEHLEEMAFEQIHALENTRDELKNSQEKLTEELSDVKGQRARLPEIMSQNREARGAQEKRWKDFLADEERKNQEYQTLKNRNKVDDCILNVEIPEMKRRFDEVKKYYDFINDGLGIDTEKVEPGKSVPIDDKKVLTRKLRQNLQIDLLAFHQTSEVGRYWSSDSEEYTKMIDSLGIALGEKADPAAEPVVGITRVFANGSLEDCRQALLKINQAAADYLSAKDKQNWWHMINTDQRKIRKDYARSLKEYTESALKLLDPEHGIQQDVANCQQGYEKITKNFNPHSVAQKNPFNGNYVKSNDMDDFMADCVNPAVMGKTQEYSKKNEPMPFKMHFYQPEDVKKIGDAVEEFNSKLKLISSEPVKGNEKVGFFTKVYNFFMGKNSNPQPAQNQNNAVKQDVPNIS